MENSDIFHMTMEKNPTMDEDAYPHILSKMAIFYFHVSFRGSNIYQNKDCIVGFVTSITRHFRYLKWRNPHLYKLY